MAELRSKLQITGTMLLGAVLLAACGGGEGQGATSPPPTEIQGISLRPELDETSGAVTLPYDRFVLTLEESELLSTAATLAMSECAKKQGVAFAVLPPLYDPIYASEGYFGPWTESQARRFGFVEPMTDADLAANGITPPLNTIGTPYRSPNIDLTDADWVIIDKCTSEASPMFTEAQRDVGPWVEPINSLSERLLKDTRARKLFDELGECFSNHGLSISKDKPWVPRGASDKEISEEQIRLALEVVACKGQINFTRKMAEIESDLEAPIIEKYADELIARKQSIETAVGEARSLVAKNETTFESY